MTDRPILFSAPMVRGLLAGTKTQTRRIINPQPPGEPDWRIADRDEDQVLWMSRKGTHVKARLRFAVGDRLYVRETHYVQSAGYRDGTGRVIIYAADGDAPCTWTPSIHMPRWASRLTLHVTEVRVQRLQDISEADAKAEGVDEMTCFRPIASHAHPENPPLVGPIYRLGYERLWESINGPGSWDANPWVVAVSFTVERYNIDQARAGS